MGYYFCPSCCLMSVLHSPLKKKHERTNADNASNFAISWVTFFLLIPSEVVIFMQYLLKEAITLFTKIHHNDTYCCLDTFTLEF